MMSYSPNASHPRESRRLESFKDLAGTTLIFGGTFDPVHLGHIEAAARVKEASGAVNVVLIPTHQNPLKQHSPVASDSDRLELLEIAIKNHSGFYVSPIECRQGGPAFTVETLTRIKTEASTLPLQFLIGSDQLPSLHKWRDYPTLISLAQVWVVGRDAAQGAAAIDSCTNLSQELREELKKRFVPLSVEISSTAVREAFAPSASDDQVQKISKFLDPAVVAAIADRKLYRSVPA